MNTKINLENLLKRLIDLLHINQKTKILLINLQNLPKTDFLLEENITKFTLQSTTNNTIQQQVSELIKLFTKSDIKFNLVFFFVPKDERIYFDANQVNLIRKIQMSLLENGGILVLIVENQEKNFVLDKYIRPGADTLTKKILGKENRNFLIYAFYN